MMIFSAAAGRRCEHASGLAKSVICPDTCLNGVFDDFKKIGARA